MVEINSKDQLSEEAEAFIESTHEAYEEEKGVHCLYTPFYFTAEDEGIIVGVISGYTCYEEVYMDDLVVAHEKRGQGIGKQLVNKVEEHFTGKGFNNINLVTNAFQAPDFYRKCGFELEYVRKNIENPKLNKYFFVKYFK